MRRDALKEFVLNPEFRTSFLETIRGETDEYARCKRKKGASCPIWVVGEGGFRLEIEAMKSIESFLSICPEHVSDYILNALLLDEEVEKDAVVFDLLHELTSP